MAWNASQNANFFESLRDLAREFHQLRQQGATLKLKFLNPAQSGAHPDYQDTSDYTEAEAGDLLNFIDHFEAFLAGDEVTATQREVWLSRFL